MSAIMTHEGWGAVADLIAVVLLIFAWPIAGVVAKFIQRKKP